MLTLILPTFPDVSTLNWDVFLIHQSNRIFMAPVLKAASLKRDILVMAGSDAWHQYNNTNFIRDMTD